MTALTRRRGEILDAAAALFAREGYRGTSMREVATAVMRVAKALGIAVLGEVLRGELERTAGQSVAVQLSGGQAGAVIARGGAAAHLAHHAFANGLDLTFVVAAAFGLVAAIAVFAFVRPAGAAPAPQQERPLAQARQTS